MNTKDCLENEKLAAMRLEQSRLNQSASTAGGMIGGYAAKECEDPCRTPLREQVHYQLREASRQSRKAVQLEELAILLEKNPEVARILDLMEVVRR